jgi:7,8-dihydropterin-6-yl-methyl-4-(beta-D-ribofuranosyl)aminobenzene 5'-phosphate synthase
MVRRTGLLLLVVLVATLAVNVCCAAQGRVTILTEAFSRWPKVKLDWGYAALIEYGGRRILFDTGNNIALLKENAASLQVDLTHLDMVVISNAQGEFTSGLRWILEMNPKVALYVPDEAMFRGQSAPQHLLTQDTEPTMPQEQRFFKGDPTQVPPIGQAYSDTKMTVVRGGMNVAAGVRLVSLMARDEAHRGQHEVSLVLETEKGPVVFVGESQPGVTNILATVMEGAARPQVYMLFGGLHLLGRRDEEIVATLDALENRFHVQRMAVGHCTGEHALLLIHQRWKKNDVYAGLGESVVF